MPEEDKTGLTYLPVDTISLKSTTTEEFIERYLVPGVPCIIRDLACEWPAYVKWTRDFFKQGMGDVPVLYYRQHEVDPDKELWLGNFEKTSLSDFFDRIERGEKIKHFGGSNPVVDFINRDSILKQDIDLNVIDRLLPEGRFWCLTRLDWRFYPWIPPYPPQMYIAGAHTRTQGHYDPDLSYTFHWCVWGRKVVKLFADDPKLNDQLGRLGNIDLFSPANENLLKETPGFKGVTGWSTIIESGQTLFMPSRMWHFFKNEEVSMSFAVRARSFCSFEKYCEFATDVHSPYKTISRHARLWRMFRFRDRTPLGKIITLFEYPLIVLTRVGVATLLLYVFVRRHVGRR